MAFNRYSIDTFQSQHKQEVISGRYSQLFPKNPAHKYPPGPRVFSVFVEYVMLSRVFHAVPSLANKKVDMSRHGEDNQSTSGEQPASDSLRVSRDRLDWMEREHRQEDTDTDALVPHIVIRDPPKKTNVGPFQLLKKKAKTLKVGWHIYMKQTVVLPGLTLACLYFTVLVL